jgi:uncharacterized protein YfaP (DUF2135 family)
MNTLQTTTIYQTKDCQLNLHFILNEGEVHYYHEAVTPHGTFIDDDFTIGNMYVLKSMESLMRQLEE